MAGIQGIFTGFPPPAFFGIGHRIIGRIQERDKIQAQDFIFINPDPSFRGSYNLLFRFLIRKLMKFPHVVPLCFISWPLQLSTSKIHFN